VVFLIRTRGRPWRDAPNRVLVISTLTALAVALAIPFSPVGAWFGFVAPPAHVTLALVAIVVAYLVSAELFKPLAISAAFQVARPNKKTGSPTVAAAA